MKWQHELIIIAIAFLVLLLFMSGCSTKYTNYNVVLRESDIKLLDARGKECQQSGFQILSDDRSKFYLSTYFSNCPIMIRRELREEEVQQWNLRKKKP